jgi:hypothetical protein
MGFWAWFWIWIGLLIASLAFYALIGLSLFNRAKEVLHQVDRIAQPAAVLLEAISSKPMLPGRESDLLSPIAKLDSERQLILKKKTKKRAARQRSLRTALKNIDVNESRFTND